MSGRSGIDAIIKLLSGTMDPALAQRVVEDAMGVVFLVGFQAGVDAVDAHGEQQITSQQALEDWIWTPDE